jgi:hypothetical protein
MTKCMDYSLVPSRRIARARSHVWLQYVAPIGYVKVRIDGVPMILKLAAVGTLFVRFLFPSNA